MRKIWIAKLTETCVDVLEAFTMNEPFNGRVMVKICSTNQIYYENLNNIANSKVEAIAILSNKLKSLNEQLERISK